MSDIDQNYFISFSLSNRIIGKFEFQKQSNEKLMKGMICGQKEKVYRQCRYNKSMSFFRKFNKTICATQFTKPNNLLLARSNTPVYLCTSQEPSIDYLNTIKTLLSTIRRLESHAQNSAYKTYVNQDLQELNSSLPRYVDNCVRYVESNGRLTAQALANLYACAEQLKVNAQWLQIYAESQIPHLIRNMSVENLRDLHSGLKKHNGSPDFIKLVEQELTTRNQEPFEYVARVVNQNAIFEYGQTPKTHNLLINAIESKQITPVYYCQKILKHQTDLVGEYLWKKPVGYALD